MARIKQRVDLEGVIKWVTGQNQQEILMAAAQLIAQAGLLEGYGNVEAAKPQNDLPPFQEYAESWYNRYKSGNRHTTQKSAKSLYNKHLYPFFGQMRLDEITIDMIQDFMNAKVKDDYAEKSIHEMRLQLGMVLESAKEDGLITINPARSKRLVIQTKKKQVREPLTREQALDIISNLHNLKSAKDRLYVALLLYTGMRRSEVLGLQGQDIDLESGIIHVRRGVTFDKNQPVVDTTKTEAGIRDVPLHPDLIPFLPELKQDCYLIYGHVENTPMTQQMVKNTWKRIQKSINVYGKTPHYFRHTFATFARRAGVDENTLKTIGGWADIETMRNVYTHTQDEDVEIAKKKMTDMFTANKPVEEEPTED